jgi:hypothetical protein
MAILINIFDSGNNEEYVLPISSISTKIGVTHNPGLVNQKYNL